MDGHLSQVGVTHKCEALEMPGLTGVHVSRGIHDIQARVWNEHAKVSRVRKSKPSCSDQITGQQPTSPRWGGGVDGAGVTNSTIPSPSHRSHRLQSAVLLRGEFAIATPILVTGSRDYCIAKCLCKQFDEGRTTEVDADWEYDGIDDEGGAP